MKLRKKENLRCLTLETPGEVSDLRAQRTLTSHLPTKGFAPRELRRALELGKNLPNLAHGEDSHCRR